MNNNKCGKLVLYTGSSGVGKGTILEEVKKRDPNIRVSISNTTRDMRDGEVNGVHYNFVSRAEFEKLISENGLLEYAEYCDNYYGTPKKAVEDMLAQGYTVILEIEVQGGLQVMQSNPDVLSIFILPPSMEELEKRLRDRGTEDEKTIRKRLDKANDEIALKDKYKFVVVNDELNKAVDEVLDIIHAN